MHPEAEDFVAGCKLRKHCPFYSLEAMVISALSQLIKAMEVGRTSYGSWDCRG